MAGVLMIPPLPVGLLCLLFGAVSTHEQAMASRSARAARRPHARAAGPGEDGRSEPLRCGWASLCVGKRRAGEQTRPPGTQEGLWSTPAAFSRDPSTTPRAEPPWAVRRAAALALGKRSAQRRQARRRERPRPEGVETGHRARGAAPQSDPAAGRGTPIAPGIQKLPINTRPYRELSI